MAIANFMELRRFLVVCLFAVMTGMVNTLASGPAMAQALPDAMQVLREQGQRMYREGLRPSGAPLQGTGAAQAELAGKNAACVNCHRRSGYGGSEGRITIRPITAPALLQEITETIRHPRIKARMGSASRPAYTEETLARALKSGLDSSGKTLDPVMPRYALDENEYKALTAYLFSLSRHSSPGVDDTEIHFATVIQPGVPADRRQAMLDVMQAFIKDKNSNMRQDERRREVGNMKMYRAYRSWKLHVWDLKGPPETWQRQLETYYNEQPVFALIGGLGATSWAPIHDFSESLELPSVLPLTELPATSTVNDYTLYFSRGMELEAEVLARFLTDQGSSGPIVQIFRRDGSGAVAAASLRSALGNGAGAQLQDVVLDGPADEGFWQGVNRLSPTAAVIWLKGADLAGAGSLPQTGTRQIYLSYQLVGGVVPEALRMQGGVRMVFPTDLSPRHDTRMLRARHWMQGRGVPPGNEVVKTNTLFTMTVVSDAIGHMGGNYSRDYFVERIEHMVGRTPIPSVYPQVSLGPGQRYAATGAQIVEFASGVPRLLSGWIVP